MSLLDFAASMGDIPMDSRAVEQLQLAYRLGDIDRQEYVARTKIEKEVRIFINLFFKYFVNIFRLSLFSSSISIASFVEIASTGKSTTGTSVADWRSTSKRGNLLFVYHLSHSNICRD